MKRIKATRVMTFTYTPNMADYPGAETLDDCIAIDEEAVDDDPELFWADVDHDETTFEVVDE
jgi:hypothetical protein